MKEYLSLGLMSGTSLDGVDLALCRFTADSHTYNYQLIAAETIPYPYYVQEKLEDALNISPNDLHDMDQELGMFYAEKIKKFTQKTGYTPDLIASHGHTVLHQPDKGITLQIGDGDVIAQQTRIIVINDFRIQDMSKGGQGAPLVPIGDRDLFNEFDFCLNLGGIANLSYDKSGKRIACDICPCNMAMNTVVSWIDMSYDNEGTLASKGTVNEDLLSRLNSLPYYKKDPPKSLGKEWFLRAFLPEIRKFKGTIEDALRTINEHIAEQVSRFINSEDVADASVLITGGGVHNHFLVDLIQSKCKATIIVPEKNLIDFKEAIVFSYLGVLRMENKINILSSVTGAKSDTSAGIINYPN